MATFALVPGGGGDPWEWHRLVPELETRGYEALAIGLPHYGRPFSRQPSRYHQ